WIHWLRLGGQLAILATVYVLALVVLKHRFPSPQQKDTTMNHLCSRSLAVILILGLVGQAYAKPGFAFTTIDVPGSNGTDAYGINDSDQIVGVFNASGTHGFLLSGGVYTAIDVPGALA